MKDSIIFEDFNSINWFNNFTEKEVFTIKNRFKNFPEDKFINLSTLQFDLFEYEDCDDYHFLVNQLTTKVSNRFTDFKIDTVNCLKKNKIELIVNSKKYKKAFRVNGSRFDIEALIDFLNKLLNANNIEERFYLLNSGSDILYPVLISPEILEKAKIAKIISVFY